jgi:hypothetical protein
MGVSLHNRLRALTLGAARQADDNADALGLYLFRHYALPLADRVLRQQTLAWAAAICERRGWRLRVYGRGWENHPDFAQFAAGEVVHGEDLRACYQSAAIHLHASVNTLVHQRVMECAMSGGLPIGRLTIDSVHDSLGHAKREAVLHDSPCVTDPDTGYVGYRVSDSTSLSGARTIREWLGLASPDIQYVKPEQVEAFGRPDHPAAGGMHAAWLFGSLRELTVRSESDLEEIIERAVQDPAWREQHSKGIAARARERCSTEAFASRLLGLIHNSLDANARPETAVPR